MSGTQLGAAGRSAFIRPRPRRPIDARACIAASVNGSESATAASAPSTPENANERPGSTTSGKTQPVPQQVQPRFATTTRSFRATRRDDTPLAAQGLVDQVDGTARPMWTPEQIADAQRFGVCWTCGHPLSARLEAEDGTYSSSIVCPNAHPTISACLIARNSIATIRRLIESVRPHVSEICIYLGGESTDGTPALLASLADEPGAQIRVEQGVWSDDYAAARNRSFAMASGSWVMWFDDDEVLQHGERLRPMLAATDADIVEVRRVEVLRVDICSCTFRARIVRRSLGAFWDGAVHEGMFVRDDAGALVALEDDHDIGVHVASPAESQVVHRPLKAPGRHDHVALIERTVAATGSHGLKVYLARELMRLDEPARAAEVLESLIAEIEPGTPRHYRWHAWQHLGEAYWRLGNTRGAYEARRQVAIAFTEWRRLRSPAAIERDRRKDELNAAHPIGPDDAVWGVVDRDGALCSEAEAEEIDRLTLVQTWESAKANGAEAAWRQVFAVEPPESAEPSVSPLTSRVEPHGAQ